MPVLRSLTHTPCTILKQNQITSHHLCCYHPSSSHNHLWTWTISITSNCSFFFFNLSENSHQIHWKDFSTIHKIVIPQLKTLQWFFITLKLKAKSLQWPAKPCTALDPYYLSGPTSFPLCLPFSILTTKDLICLKHSGHILVSGPLLLLFPLFSYLHISLPVIFNIVRPVPRLMAFIPSFIPIYFT